MGGGSGSEIPIFISTPAIVMAGKTLTRVKRIAPQNIFFTLLPPLFFPDGKELKNALEFFQYS
jgi:hypothetical protein